jgi:hypothetical protein
LLSSRIAQSSCHPRYENTRAARPVGPSATSGTRRSAAADPRQQLARIERLRQIIVSAHLEAEDAIDLFSLR